MKLEEKIELFIATSKVANFWEVEPVILIALMAAYNEKKAVEWDEIFDEIKSFHEASLDEQAKMLGIKLPKNKK